MILFTQEVEYISMEWIKFKDELPRYNEPIFVYKTDGVFSFFKRNDDIRACYLVEKSETDEGLYYYLKGWEYGMVNSTRFEEKDFLNMQWMPIPKP